MYDISEIIFMLCILLDEFERILLEHLRFQKPLTHLSRKPDTHGVEISNTDCLTIKSSNVETLELNPKPYTTFKECRWIANIIRTGC